MKNKQTKNMKKNMGISPPPPQKTPPQQWIFNIKLYPSGICWNFGKLSKQGIDTSFWRRFLIYCNKSNLILTLKVYSFIHTHTHIHTSVYIVKIFCLVEMANLASTWGSCFANCKKKKFTPLCTVCWSRIWPSELLDLIHIMQITYNKANNKCA